MKKTLELEGNDCALVFREGGLEMYLPVDYEGLEVLAPHMILCIALMAHLADHEWQENVYEEFLEEFNDTYKIAEFH